MVEGGHTDEPADGLDGDGDGVVVDGLGLGRVGADVAVGDDEAEVVSLGLEEAGLLR